MKDEIIATLTPSPVRRRLAVLSLGALAFLVLWAAFTAPPRELGWLAAMVLAGVVLLWAAWRLWTATAHQLMLTREGLFDSSGACLTRLENIVGVERGVFAFKPSGGFVLSLKTAQRRDWAPGLWWRFGRTLGVGGVTPAMQGKVLAEAISMILIERERAAE